MIMDTANAFTVLYCGYKINVIKWVMMGNGGDKTAWLCSGASDGTPQWVVIELQGIVDTMLNDNPNYAGMGPREVLAKVLPRPHGLEMWCSPFKIEGVGQ